MTKEEIIEQGQKFCTSSFEVAERNQFYTAWSSCGKLVEDGLITRSNTLPTLFALTEKGEDMAGKLLTASLHDDAVNTATQNIALPEGAAGLPKARSLPFPAPKPAPPKETKVKQEKAEPPTHLKRAATENLESHKTKHSKVEVPAPKQPPPQLQSRVHIIPERSPTPPTDHELTPPPVPAPAAKAAVGGEFEFSYIAGDSDKELVLMMEDAFVEVDSEQLVYQIEFPSSMLKHPFIQHVVRVHKHPTKPGFHWGFVLEESAKDRSTYQATSHTPTGPIVPSPVVIAAPTAAAVTPAIPASSPRKMARSTSASSSSSSTLPNDAPPTLPRANSAPSSSALPANHKIITFEPNSYDLILLLDTREMKSTKERDFLIAGLQRNEVRCEQRSLIVGDFLWVARHKGGHFLFLCCV